MVKYDIMAFPAENALRSENLIWVIFFFFFWETHMGNFELALERSAVAVLPDCLQDFYLPLYFIDWFIYFCNFLFEKRNGLTTNGVRELNDINRMGKLGDPRACAWETCLFAFTFLIDLSINWCHFCGCSKNL